jgi:hypothetical protein
MTRLRLGYAAAGEFNGKVHQQDHPVILTAALKFKVKLL